MRAGARGDDAEFLAGLVEDLDARDPADGRVDAALGVDGQAIAAALGDLAADRVLAFAAPALPLQQRLVEEETRLRLKRQRVDPEGDRPTTEAPEPPPTAASLEANLVLRCAERRGQDDVASNEPWNVNRTLYTTRSGILAPARNWWTAGLEQPNALVNTNLGIGGCPIP